jgi:hypothetical protein
MEKLIEKTKGNFKGTADRVAVTLKDISYKADMAAKAVAKIVKGVLTSRRSTRRLRTLGGGAGVIVFVLSALLSGCYYRGRPPEYGHRGYGHRYDRRY